MAKNEADYKREIVDAMKRYGGYARRVEDQYAVGTLDLILSTPRTGLVLAEAKIIRNTKFAPSPRQYVEMRRITVGGGVALLIGVGETGHWYLHEYVSAIENGVYREDCVAGGSFPETFELWFQMRIEKNVR